MKEDPTVGAIINQVDAGPFQRRLLAICSAGWAFDAMEILLIAFVLPVVAFEWRLSPAQSGLIGTSIFIGMLIGAWFWGVFSDYAGRKKAFLATVAIYSVFTLLCAFSPDYLWLAFLRGIAGFGVGGMLPVANVLLSEFTPTKKRGRYLGYLESSWIIGTLLAAGLSWYIIPTYGWRILFIIAGFPVILILFIWRFVPESPRYLLVKGQTNRAIAILRKMAKVNKVDLKIDKIAQVVSQKKMSIVALWDRKLVRVTVFLWITWFFITMCNYGILIWMPTYFFKAMDVFTPNLVYSFVFLSSMGQIPGYLLGIYVVDKLGRRRTISAYVFLTGLFTYLFAISTDSTQIILSAFFLNFTLAGVWIGIYVYTPELYPTEIRSTGVAWASSMGRIGASIGPMLAALLMPISIYLTLTIFAVSFFIAGFTILGIKKETRGKELKEVL